MKSFILLTTTAIACLCTVGAAPAPGRAEQALEPTIEQTEKQAFEAEQQARQAGEREHQAEARLKEVNKAWAKAQKSMRLAERGAGLAEAAEGDEPDGPISDVLTTVKDQMFALAAPARSMGKPLIIRSANIDAKTHANLQEDLAVMSRILNKAAGQRGGREEHDWAMGIVVSSLGGQRRPQSLYLEGYGALFLLNAKFPLVPPPKKEVEEKKQDEATDSEWEQAKDELFGNPKPRRAWAAPLHEGPKAAYDPDRVAELKKDLFEALKNATHIRNLKPDEFITLAVTGSDSRPDTAVRHLYRNEGPNRQPRPNGPDRFDLTIPPADKSMGGEETHLVIRVKKADVDSFAKGKITAEELEKKGAAMAY